MDPTNPRPEGAQGTHRVPSLWSAHPTESRLRVLQGFGAGGQWAPQGTPGVFWGEGGGRRRSARSGASSASPTALSPLGPPHPTGPDSASACPQSRDRKVLGDYSGALSYGSTAKYLNITALVINIVIVILVIVFVSLALAGVFSPRPYGPYGYGGHR